jgi:hypothetical protein
MIVKGSIRLYKAFSVHQTGSFVLVEFEGGVRHRARDGESKVGSSQNSKPSYGGVKPLLRVQGTMILRRVVPTAARHRLHFQCHELRGTMISSEALKGSNRGCT